MACVYWIRHVSHTDVLSEGYIGVTSRRARQRFNEHMRSSKHSNYPVHAAIREYGRESLVVETLVICDINYAYELERKLRPEPNTGWNLGEGGHNSARGRIRGLTEAERRRQAEALRGLPKTLEHKRNISAARKKYYAENPPPRGLGSTTNHAVWSIADKIYLAYQAGMSVPQICEKFAIPKPSNLHTMIYKYFKNGWSPFEDSAWITRYQQGTVQ